MISHPSVTCQHNIRFLSIVIAIPSHWARNMQQGGSNHHHELFISLSALSLGPTPSSKSRGQHPTKTHRGPFFILYWKRIHLHSGGCDGRKVQAIKNLCLLMPRAGRDLAPGIICTFPQVCMWTKNVLRERKKKRLLRGLNVAAAHLDSIRRVTAPAHVHEFCKQPAKNP